MVIVILYDEIVGYVQGMLRAVQELEPNAEVHVVSNDKNLSTFYEIEHHQHINFYPRSSMTSSALTDFVFNLQPNLIFNSGWSIKDYVAATRHYKRRHPDVKVVVALDNQWSGTLRQLAGSVLYRWRFKSYIDYFWIAGKPQYHFVRRLGFKNDQIISNLYSANTFLFKEKATVSQRFVYLGRFAEEKNILFLIQAYQCLPEKVKSNWPLHLIGDGPLRNQIEELQDDYIIIHGFLQSEQLNTELLKGGVFISPSTFENWGVTIHEMALLGYPLLSSRVCGANTEFLIEGHNGYSFDPNDGQSLIQGLTRMTDIDEVELQRLSQNSHEMGQRINSYMSAASLLSVLRRC